MPTTKCKTAIAAKRVYRRLHRALCVKNFIGYLVIGQPATSASTSLSAIATSCATADSPILSEIRQ